MNRSRTTKMLIFLSIVTTIIVTTFSLSKYESSVAGDSSAKVAKYVVDLSAENIVIPVTISPLQNEKTYIFSVTDTKDGKESEVAMEYTLEIQSLENLPLEFELYMEDDKQETTNLLEGNGNITETIKMNLEESEHTYKLKIKWREKETHYLYSQTIDYIQIILATTQAD